MRRVFGAALVVAFALTVGSASGRDEKKGPPEGTYLLIGLEIGGKPVPDEFFTKAPETERTLEIMAGKLIATRGSKEGKEGKEGKEDKAVFTVDTTKAPFQIDLTAKKADGKDDLMYGIYKVDGDKLIICFIQSDKKDDRPKEFKTTADSKAMLMTLKLKLKK